MMMDRRAYISVVFSILVCLVVCVSAQSTISLVQVSPPTGNSYAPVPVTNTVNQYDIPAGSNLIVACGESETSLRYPTNQFAQFDRFGLGTRVRVSTVSTGDQWTFDSLKYYDTGVIECYNTADSNNASLTSSVYIFVYDPNEPLYVPLNTSGSTGSISVTVKKDEYVPCLPTHSSITFTLSLLGRLVLPNAATLDNTQGFKLLQKPPLLPRYTCSFTYADTGRTGSVTIHVTIAANISLPSPVVFPSDGKHKHLAGEDLQLNCTIYGYTQIRLVDWSYPAQSCDIQPSNSCVGTQDRVTIQGPKILPGGTDVSDILTLTNLQVSDSGSYQCKYQPNTQMVYSDSASVEIRVLPGPFVKVVVTDEESEVEALAGSSVILMAHVEAIPTLTVQWLFNGKSVSGNRFMSNSRSTGTPSDYEVFLTISLLSIEDAGTYTLLAKSSGSISDQQDIQLVVNVPPQIMVSYVYESETVSVMSNPHTTYFQLYKEVELDCTVTEGFPSPQLSWMWQSCDNTKPDCIVDEVAWQTLPTTLSPSTTTFDNSPYFTSSSSSSQSLLINAERSGWYQCSAENGIDSPAMYRIFTVVSALPPSSKGIGFSTQTVQTGSQLVVGDNFYMHCHVARFECLASQVAITGSGGVRYTQGQAGVLWAENDNSYILSVTLTGITRNMTGNRYLCGCNSKTSDVMLTVQEFISPFWALQLEPKANMTAGETKTFQCKADGQPLPEVTWYKDDKKILNDSTTVVLGRNSHSLTIYKATLEDSGSYSCVGTARRSPPIYSNFTLTVTGATAKLKDGEIAMIVVLVLVVIVIAVVITICIVRRYCRKKYTPHTLLLPSKEMINPDIPLDEQTDALPYDIGWEFPLGNLKMGMLLGQGAFGRVLKAEAMNIEEGVSSTTVAVKAVRDHSDIEQVKALISELKILIHIGQHLNIVNLLGACTKDISKGHILVIVEFCRHGNLRSYLLKHRSTYNPSMDVTDGENTASVKLGHVTVDMAGDDDYLNPGTTDDKPVSMRDLLSWCYQIARGMEYLASIDYIHRDLAARNVLLADDNIVKICDFGLAKDIYKYQEYQKQTDGPLPIKWMALESLTHKVFNVRTDVWAYGVTVWELFSLAATPYPGWEIDDTFIDKLQEGYRMEIPKHCPEQIYQDVMLNCWHPDPEKRPNFAELADMMGESVDQTVKDKLLSLEDPYLRNRDSRTDITIRPSSVRKRDRRDLESDYLPSKALQPKANGSRAQNNYYNTSPTGSQPNQAAKSWRKEKASDEEKLPLHVTVEDDIDMPSAPAPSPWEGHSQLAKRATLGDDSHSLLSADSDSARPPSYNYVMKKSEPVSSKDSSAASTSAAVQPLGSRSASRDALTQPPSQKSYIETTC